MTASAIAKALELEHADIAASVTPVELREVLMNSKDIVKNDVYYQFSGAVGQQPLQSSESSKQAVFYILKSKQ